LAYDAVDHTVILFGGGSPSGVLGDTWSFSHGQWTSISPAGAPPYRRAAAMTYDGADGYILLFGGLGNSSDLSDTWSYVNGTWSPISSPRSPSIRVAVEMAYDPLLQRVVLFGGRDDNTNTAEHDTWLFHNGSWHRLALALHPTGRWYPGLDYDASAHAILMFGGQKFSRTSGSGYANLGDTEMFDRNGW
jgi:hypothetical protein